MKNNKIPVECFYIRADVALDLLDQQKGINTELIAEVRRLKRKIKRLEDVAAGRVHEFKRSKDLL